MIPLEQHVFDREASRFLATEGAAPVNGVDNAAATAGIPL